MPMWKWTARISAPPKTMPLLAACCHLPAISTMCPSASLRFLTTKGWRDGADGKIAVYVTSRPTLLYKRLFTTSMGGDVIRDALIAIAIVFGVL